VPVPCSIASKPFAKCWKGQCIAGVSLPLTPLVLCSHDSNFGVGANCHSHAQNQSMILDVDSMLLQSWHCVELAALM